MTLLFMLIIIAGMPLLAAISYRNIKTLESQETNLQLSKAPIYFQSMVMQAGICWLAYFVAKQEGFQISLKGNYSFYTIGASVLFLIIALSFAFFAQRFKDKNKESTLQYLLPQNSRERLLWILAVIVAAFCEEYMYRGVLYQLMLVHTDGKIWAAVLLSAVIFGFGHGTQGEKAIIQIIPFAVGFHILAIFSDGLLLPMIVHFVYNISVELFFGNKIIRQ
jgi:membrane protease YdiL (CAAX protease family)